MLAACAALGAVVCEKTMAAPVRLTVPFSVDRVQTPSGMALEIEGESLAGRTMEQLAATPPGALKAFSTLIGHFAAGRATEAAAMLRPQAFQASDDAAKYAQNMAAAFKDGWATLAVQRRYDLGPETWITWEVTTGGQPVRRMSRFAEVNGRWLWSDELQSSSLRTVQTVITASEQLEAGGHPEARKVEGMAFKHKGLVPGTRASWLFNGFACNWDAFGQAAPPDHPVTRLYGEAARALHAGDVPGYAGYYTEFSGQRIKEAVAKMDDPQKVAYFDSLRQLGRRVTFVLEASPIFLVFYETTGRGMLYDTLFAPGGDVSKLKFCNFMVESFIDDILKDQGFFHDPVIRLLAGRPEDPPKVGAATPPNNKTSSAVTAALPAAGPLVASTTSPTATSSPSPRDPSVPGGIPFWGWLLILVLLLLVFRFLRPRS